MGKTGKPFTSRDDIDLKNDILDVVDQGLQEMYMEELLELTSCSHEGLRHLASWAIIQWRGDRAASLARSLVRSEYPEVRENGIIGVVEHELEDGCSMLLEVLSREEDPNVLATLAAAAGDLKCLEMAKRLLKMVPDAPHALRYEFLLAAARNGLEEAGEGLISYLKDRRRSIEAAQMLISLGYTPALEHAREAVRGLFIPHSVKIPAAALMASLGDDSMKEYLIGRTNSWFIETKLLAIHFLGLIPREWAGQRLEELTSSKDGLISDAATDAIRNWRSMATK